MTVCTNELCVYNWAQGIVHSGFTPERRAMSATHKHTHTRTHKHPALAGIENLRIECERRQRRHATTLWWMGGGICVCCALYSRVRAHSAAPPPDPPPSAECHGCPSSSRFFHTWKIRAGVNRSVAADLHSHILYICVVVVVLLPDQGGAHSATLRPVNVCV